MRRPFLAIAVFGLLFVGGHALAQGGGGSTGSEGGGSTSTGSSSTSMEVHTSGPASVGVVQGNVSEGGSSSGGTSTGAGSAQGGSSSGGGGGSVSTADRPAPVASQDGVVRRVDLPALQLADTSSAARKGPDVLTWAIAAIIIVGLVVLYRRLPRPTRA